MPQPPHTSFATAKDPDTPGLEGKVQRDGVSFVGIVWFLVVVFVTAAICEAIVGGTFSYFAYDFTRSDTGAAPTAGPAAMPQIVNGRVVAGTRMPEPELLADDPEPLIQLRAEEDQSLTTYGVVDKNAGVYRLPIDKAKDLLLVKGLPTRPGGK